MALAERLNIKDYPSPAGGCLLTEKAFSRRLRDLISSADEIQIREIELLKLGRHFRVAPETKLVVGRNKKENEAIRALATDGDLMLTSVSAPGPTVLLLGPPEGDAVVLAARVTAAYSDVRAGQRTRIRMTGPAGEETLEVETPPKQTFRALLIR
jgi:predicted ribosome quality control (RQC) complex YloA/Tae2 family protein